MFTPSTRNLRYFSLILRLNAVLVSEDADPPLVQLNIMLTTGRKNPSVLVPRPPPLNRAGANTSSASAKTNLLNYHPVGDKFVLLMLILLIKTYIYALNRKTKVFFRLNPLFGGVKHLALQILMPQTNVKPVIYNSFVGSGP